MKALWANDIHLEFLDPRQYDEFLRRLAETECDCLLLGGDIGTAPNILGYLSDIQRTVRKPVYFVLGNHDYYRGSISAVRAAMQELHVSPRWLGGMEFEPLTHKTCLVGHDGWGDGRYGNYAQSRVSLNDFELIRELKGLSRDAQLAKMMALGDEAAEHFGRVLPKALAAAEHVVVLTHVSPFVESCIHEGRPSDADWLPFFSCKAVGDPSAQATGPGWLGLALAELDCRITHIRRESPCTICWTPVRGASSASGSFLIQQEWFHWLTQLLTCSSPVV